MQPKTKEDLPAGSTVITAIVPNLCQTIFASMTLAKRYATGNLPLSGNVMSTQQQSINSSRSQVRRTQGSLYGVLCYF